MPTPTAHGRADIHRHTHGPGCGHAAIVHADHVDYLLEGHRYREHLTDEGVHYDECTVCDCPHCADSCATCNCQDCSCRTCNHNACQCANCQDSCNNCLCPDCSCTTCDHAS